MNRGPEILDDPSGPPEPPDLPELAARMERLASSRTAGSRPWPALDRAVRRSRRRRIATAAAGVAAALVIGTGTASVLGAGPFGHDQRDQRQSISVVTAAGLSLPVGTRVPENLRAAGLLGPIGGSLAGDAAFIDAVRRRVAGVANSAVPAGSTGPRTRAAEVLVLWAGDSGSDRIAYAAYILPGASEQGPLQLIEFLGPAGSSVDDLAGDVPHAQREVSPRGVNDVTVAGGGAITSSTSTVLVLASRATSVQVATSRRIMPDGEIRTTWRSLHKDGGMVWTTRISRREQTAGQIRIDGRAEVMRGLATRQAGLDLSAAARPVCAPGTNTQDVKDALSTASEVGLTGHETPVLCGTWTGGGDRFTSVVVATVGGGHLAAVKVTSIKGSAVQGGRSSVTAYAIATTPAPNSKRFALAVDLGELPWRPGQHALAVITPAGVAQVQAQAQSGSAASAPVTHRLALLQASPSGTGTPDPAFRVSMSDQTGRVVATVERTPSSSSSVS